MNADENSSGGLALDCDGVITSGSLGWLSSGGATASGGMGGSPPASGALVAVSSPGGAADWSAGTGALVLSSDVFCALAEIARLTRPVISRLKNIFFIGFPFHVVASIVSKHHLARPSNSARRAHSLHSNFHRWTNPSVPLNSSRPAARSHRRTPTCRFPAAARRRLSNQAAVFCRRIPASPGPPKCP